MRHLKLAGICVLVTATVLALGFLWGSRGRWAAEERLGVVERQLLLSDARRETYAGSLELQKLNFGAAAGHFEAARAASDQVRLRFEAAGDPANSERAATAAGATRTRLGRSVRGSIRVRQSEPNAPPARWKRQPNRSHVRRHSPVRAA